MRATLLIIVIILANYISFSQADSTLSYRKGVLVAKLKPEFRQYGHSEGITYPGLNLILADAGNFTVSKIFPNHLPPAKDLNANGDKLVDITLIYEVKYDGSYMEDMLARKLMSTGIFDYVEKRQISKLFTTTNDPYLSNQFYLNRVKAYQAWDIETGDTNVVLGITDTGTDRTHSDLPVNLKINYQDPLDGLDNDNDGFTDNYYGWDLGMNDNNPQIYASGHGSFVTGVSSATHDNNVGIAGVGKNIKYLPVKVDDEYAHLTKDYEGLVYAADHGCSIINASWGGPMPSRFGQDIVNYATFNRDALVVAACGNSDGDWLFYPASYENVISCAGTDSLDAKWVGSSYGTQVDISAPGTAIFSTWLFNGYTTSSGTSFSAPMVSAAAALVRSHFPWMTAQQAGEQLRVTADNIDTLASNAAYTYSLGAGRLNIYNALTDTTKPSIRFVNRNYVFTSNDASDTLKIYGDFKNFLAQSSPNLAVKISTTSPYLQILDTGFVLGNIGMMQLASNIQPFRVKISPAIPFGYYADFKLTYSDTAYSGFEFFRVEFNKDYLKLDTNNISTTVTAKGTIGFNDRYYATGEGFYHQNSTTLFGCAGLVVGNSTGKVSDNIYNELNFDYDFNTFEKSRYITSSDFGDQTIYSVFKDDSANYSKLNLKVRSYVYAFDTAGLEDVIFLKYIVKNVGFTTLSTIYSGFYVDFDLGKSYKNYATYDSQLKLFKTVPVDDGKYGGLMIFDTSSTIYAYGFDNIGSDSSINISDGFLDYEKYEALKMNRDSAGYSIIIGNDVSTMLSTGPHVLAPNDSLELNFALIASDHIFDFDNAAQNAIYKYYNYVGISQTSILKDIKVYPNPAKDIINFELSNYIPGNCSLEIFNSTGQVIHKEDFKLKTRLTTNNLKPGVYFYSITGGTSARGKFVVI